MEWAQPSDLQKLWFGRGILPGNAEQQKALLARAKRKIELAYKTASLSLEDALASNLTTEEDLKSVQVDLAMAVLKNPMGVRSLNEAAGPYSGGITFSGDYLGTLFMTDEMYEQLGIPSFPMSRRSGMRKTWGEDL